MKKIVCGHATDTGRKRKKNEDSYSADPEKGVFIIADGMGGHEGGAVASAIVVRSVRNNLYKGMQLDEALKAAHQNVLKAVNNGIGRRGMGATAVALQVNGQGFEIGWVGDSRAYLWDGELKRLTRDHTYVQRMMDKGVLTEDEAREHPKRNVLTQALGAEDIPAVSVGKISGPLSPGQKILLCSDGLTSELKDDQIAFILKNDKSDQDCVATLIKAANDHEGKDNISVIVVSLEPDNLKSSADDYNTLPDRIRGFFKKNDDQE